MGSILRASGGSHLIPTVAVDEVVYVLEDDTDTPGALVKKVAELEPAIRDGLILPCEPENDDEAELFVRLAAQLDDAEACCLALAVSRGLQLATDDRKAITMAHGLGATVVTTPGLLKRWSDLRSPSQKKLATAIGRIERYGRFVPPSDSPQAPWWHRNRRA
jgi:hypothetical protein